MALGARNGRLMGIMNVMPARLSLFINKNNRACVKHIAVALNTRLIFSRFRRLRNSMAIRTLQRVFFMFPGYLIFCGRICQRQYKNKSYAGPKASELFHQTVSPCISFTKMRGG
jgi:hypothetical protein